MRVRHPLIRFVVLFLALPLASADGEVWFEDFTDGELGDDSPLEWSLFPSGEINSSGLRMLSPAGAPSAGARVTNLVPRQGWSMRGQVRLLQSHGFLGPAIAIQDSGAGSLWSLISADGDLQFGNQAEDLATPTVSSDLRPMDREVVIQLDTFEGVIKLWAWHADEPPTAELPPMVEDVFPIPVGFPTLWTRSNDGPSQAVWSSMLISTTHLAIPEPAAFGTTLVTVAGLLFCRRRRSSVAIRCAMLLAIGCCLTSTERLRESLLHRQFQ